MKGILYLQSSYSMLKSMIPLETLVLEAKNKGYQFLALSDDQLHGTYELFNLCKKHQIKPILGLRLKVDEPNETVFLVYVKNDIGYKNLLKLSYLKASNQKISIDDLVRFQNGLIFVTAGYESIIDQTILYGNEDSIIDYIKKYQTVFDDFYLGLSFNHEIQKNVSGKKIYEVAINNNIKILPVQKSTYIDESDISTYESLIKIDNDHNKVEIDANYKLLDLNEINDLYSNYPRVSKDLSDFTNSINFHFNLPKFKMPTYKTKTNADNKEYIKELARLGLERRLKINNIKLSSVYIDRLNHELNVICEMNFENYFLIVYDFVKYAKDNNVLVGPGRGSAAGSLVAYCLGITNVDPIKYNLMFERFLNPARMSMPDIDLDFPDNKRDFVIEYVKDKYGSDYICSISTYTTLALRSSIRDIARVNNIATSRTNAIVNAVVQGKVDESDREVMKVLNVAKKIEGLYRQTGTHAAGIILSNENLRETIPLQKGPFSFSQSQFDAKTLEELGLHKIDFLGIRNLTIISDILEKLEKKNIKINLDKIPFDDKKTFDLLSNAKTTGIFQLESPGMRKVLQKLKPREFEDLVATLALFRPGPMQNIDIYIARKNGKKFNYLDETLKPILKSTYGIIIYQEQIMQIAQTFAGYSLFEADMLRVGVSKKNLDILEKEREKFVTKSIENGFDFELATKIYDYIVRFADYGFNRSHSVSYGIVAYQMAYLKANYYSTFMEVLLSSVIGNESQTKLYIEEVIKSGIKVLPPSLNYSTDKYEEVDNAIIMPLISIKGLGFKTVIDIINTRGNIKFKDFLEIKDRLSKVINEKQLINLIHAGSLDFLGYNHKTLAENSDLSNIGYEKFIKDFKLRETKDYSFHEKNEFEKDVLGVNLIYDLSRIVDKHINNKTIFKISTLPEKDGIYVVVGIVNSIKKIKSKNNNEFLVVNINDDKKTEELYVFSDKIDYFKDINNNDLIKIRIKKSKYNNKTTFYVEEVQKI